MTCRSLPVLAMCLIVFGVSASEEKIALDKLPAKVKAALKAKYPDAKLLSAAKEEENKKILYEVSLEDKGAKMDVVFHEDGTIDAIEKVIAAKDLPTSVTDALEAKYPKATIKKTEEITKGEALTYEVLFVTAEKKTFEVVFDSKGKILLTEAKKDKKEYKED
jgi:Putative beta-lactamase-inhibitor-like, PepSY-like